MVVLTTSNGPLRQYGFELHAIGCLIRFFDVAEEQGVFSIKLKACAAAESIASTPGSSVAFFDFTIALAHSIL